MRYRLSLRFTVLLAAVAAAVGIVAGVATAGSPHQVGTCTTTTGTNTLSITCKEAGLGDEDQIEIYATATASCINPGDHHPKATNKQSLSISTPEPVQNGQANYTITFTASFQPDCSPPMTVVFSNVTVTDTTNGFDLKL
jgi:hypothetical protein